jgi:hypothetical protein
VLIGLTVNIGWPPISGTNEPLLLPAKCAEPHLPDRDRQGYAPRQADQEPVCSPSPLSVNVQILSPIGVGPETALLSLPDQQSAANEDVRTASRSGPRQRSRGDSAGAVA